MSVNSILDVCKSEDYFSARSNISEDVRSLNSLNIKEMDPMDLLQKIGQLQDSRYDASYSLTQYKQKVIEIERQELDLMKESTLRHAKLQEDYISTTDEEQVVKNMTKKAAERLGIMKFELKQIGEQVQNEQQKLEELEEQLQKLVEKIDSCTDDDIKTDLMRQEKVVEDQRDQQSKVYEDLEFKELETQSRFEEESELIKRNIIEAQRKFIMASRDRENKKMFLDEQQIVLMKTTRKHLDKLESERNYCNQQIAYFQNIVNSCTVQIEKLNVQLDKVKQMEMFEQALSNGLTDKNIRSEDGVYSYLADYTSQIGEDKPNPSNLIGRSCNPNGTNDLATSNKLRNRLDSLTEVVRMNLPLSSDENGHHQPTSSQIRDAEVYSSTLSLSDDSSSAAKADSDVRSKRRQKKITSVTFECSSIGESLSSTHSLGPDDNMKLSRTDLASDTSNPDERSCQLDSRSNSVICRKKDGSRQNKQARPLTCFLPKLHSDFNLRHHIESCGHDLTLCRNYVEIDVSSCQGFLWKRSGRLFDVWHKRWFHFDHGQRQLTYYNHKAKSKVKGVVEFRAITDVFIDHTHRTKAPQKLSFCIETKDKTYHLVGARPELVTLWVDVIFTGAEGYLALHHPSMISSVTSHMAD